MSQNNDHRFALPQEQLPPFSLSMRELSAERHRYLVMPSFQRSIVWGIRQCQALIDTMLLGENVPELEGYQYYTDDGQAYWSIIDGHQRLTTVLRYMSGEFRTWTATQKQRAEPNSDAPVEPGKYFDELSPIARNYFLDYRFTIVRVRNKSPQQLITRFLRIQNHVPLSAAERLNAYISRAKDAAKQIERHSFWEDFYDGRTNREQLFQSALFLVGLEVALPKQTVDLMSGKYMHMLACGQHDELITDAIVERVMDKLDKMSLIFYGSHFTQRTTTIAMYQAVEHLESAGYTISQADRGKLTPWLMNVIAESKRGSSTPNYAKQIQQMLRESTQKAFWERHLQGVLATFDIGLMGKVPVA